MAIFVNKIFLVLPCAGILLQLPSLAGAIWYVNEGIEQFGNIEAYPAPVRTCSQLSFARTHVAWQEGNHVGDSKERRQGAKSDGSRKWIALSEKKQLDVFYSPVAELLHSAYIWLHW